MKVIDVDYLQGTERDVQGVGFNSIRPLLASDGMGFTFCRTHIKKGGPYFWHYKNHLEACYIIDGHAELKDMATGANHILGPGMIYVLDKHDPHRFIAKTDVVLVSVFNPPLTGNEIHQKDGSYV